MRVADVMSKDVVTATPEDTLLAVAQQMLTQSISCVVVTHQARVVGILTEKDMLDFVAGGDTDFRRVAVSERMSSPVDTIAAEASLLEADRMMETLCVRRLPVVENGRLAGIVTQTDITRALISLNSLGGVSDIMTRHVATVSIDATAMEAARMMSCANFSCLIVTREEKIVGILTEKDLLKRVIAPQKDPTQIRVLDVMSLPVVTIPPNCSILDASRKMETMHFHRLLVSDGKGICGLVTQTDIMRAVCAVVGGGRIAATPFAGRIGRPAAARRPGYTESAGLPRRHSPSTGRTGSARVASRRFRNRRFLALPPLRKYRDNRVFLREGDNRGDFCPQLCRGRIENSNCCRRNASIVCEQTEAHGRDIMPARWVRRRDLGRLARIDHCSRTRVVPRGSYAG